MINDLHVIRWLNEKCCTATLAGSLLNTWVNTGPYQDSRDDFIKIKPDN